ncbi:MULTISPECIES: FKBP-type peptidyl-prolyl cis-trans isomerase [unclassified Nocardioides]|uniref:FKBP-type peptidyl-prolyl cis-trans isomerase n=1 Tax=unclassified Nocardioides TaxID=2615069 RepID=UPI0006F52EE6|nr:MULTISPECIES: FKBP-type peptidyl-prolyl cis-trans isomerase [unclassified Nocardioides]KQY54609.1 peptidylprolyl isomerase [Nocardioides sp. Root140]KQZ66483.1 peptidylprolyl isomerase [Nocardioides sp. Root151]KRF19706.1 peptidylprolyl isomerase [Nocardioides sp. Soil796]
MRTARRITAVLAVTAALLATAACGDSDSDDSSDDNTDSAAVCTADDIEVSGEFGEKPEVTLPDDCTPPTEVITKDLSAGSGPEAKAGDTVLTDYLLVTWSNQQVLDNSFDRGEPFPVTPLGQAPVIDGWNEGLVGIQEGARRLIIIPPAKGYGAGGNGVEPNETLVFVVDAVAVS